MKRFIAIVLLGASVGAIVGCANPTWGPGLMYWSNKNYGHNQLPK
jgi:hypothetical protein